MHHFGVLHHMICMFVADRLDRERMEDKNAYGESHSTNLLLNICTVQCVAQKKYVDSTNLHLS